MTDDATSDLVTPADAADAPTDELALDYELSDLVDLINGSESSYPLILTTGGLIVIGTLVSGHRFFEALRPDEQPTDGLAEGETYVGNLVRSNFTDAAKRYRDTDGDEYPRFLHLVDVTIKTGTYSLDLHRWRGRLSEVSGWTIATLAPIE